MVICYNDLVAPAYIRKAVPNARIYVWLQNEQGTRQKEISRTVEAYKMMSTEIKARKPDNKRMIQLDVLRGLAILLVLGHHYAVSPKSAGVLHLPATLWTRFGWTGVDLFFVLSGFLVGGLLMRELKLYGRLDVKRFLIRRGFKIWPVYYLYLVVVAIQLFLLKPHYAIPTWQMLLQYVLPLQNYNIFHLPYSDPQIAYHTWSLAVEEHFYLLLPLFLLFLAREKRRIAWIPAIAVVLDLVCLTLRLSAHGPYRAWNQAMPTHLRIDSLFTGVVLAYWYHFRPDIMARLTRYRPMLAGIGLLLVAPLFLMPYKADRFVWTFGFTMLSVGYACLLTVCVTTPVGEGLLGRWFASPVAKIMATIGGFSYSIYVWHIVLVKEPLQEWISGGVLESLPASVRWSILTTLYIALAVGVGIALAKLTEVPSLRLRDALFPGRTDALGPIRAKDAAPLNTEEEPTEARS